MIETYLQNSDHKLRRIHGLNWHRQLEITEIYELPISYDISVAKQSPLGISCTYQKTYSRQKLQSQALNLN